MGDGLNGYLVLNLVENFDGALPLDSGVGRSLRLVEQCRGETCQVEAEVGTHAHLILVEILARLIVETPTELVHDIVIHSLSVDSSSHALTVGRAADWGDALREALELEVVVESGVVLAPYGHGVVEGALPLAGDEHIENHELVLENIAARDGDLHLLLNLGRVGRRDGTRS